MEFSCAYHVRLDKIAKCQVPTFTEVKNSLGEELSNVLIETCPISLQEELALRPYLNGPGSELWISPSDLLVDKVALKPPYTSKYMKALTHEAILDIGRVVELRVLAELEREKQSALKEQEKLLLFIAEKQKKRAIEETLEREEYLFKMKLVQLNDEFETLLQQELQKLEEELKEMYEKLLEERTAELLKTQEEYLKVKIEEAAGEAFKSLSVKFVEEMKQQERELSNMYHMKLQGQAEKYDDVIKAQQEMFQQLLKQLNHNLQCNNIANLMYLLCRERRKAFIENQTIAENYLKKLEKLQASHDTKAEQLDSLKIENEHLAMKIRIREQCLRKIIQQFQKFINFALESVPSQAEFLLDIGKMMTFELIDTITKVDKKKRIPVLMPWKTAAETNALNELKQKVTPRDYHNCLNELPMPRKSDSDQSLYAISVKNDTYVREDFRNKIQSGLPVRPSSLIWNKDVENLIEVLKGSTGGSAKIDENAPDEEDSHDYGSITHQRSRISRRSSVHFNRESAFTFDDETSNVGILAAQDSIIIQKSIRSNRFSNEEEVNRIQNYNTEQRISEGVALLATTDSLTMVKNVGHVSNPNLVEEREAMKVISTDTIKLNKSKQAIESKDFDKRRSKDDKEGAFRTISNDTFRLPNMTKKNTSSKIPSVIELDSMGKQSIESKLKKSSRSVPKASLPSKITLHRDSVEIIRKSVSSYANKMKQIVLSNTFESPMQMVINVPQDNKLSDVNFSNLITVLHDIQKPLYKPWKMHEKEKPEKKPRRSAQLGRTHHHGMASKRDDFFKKTGAAKVLGKCDKNREPITISQPADKINKDFTLHRMDSLLGLLKNDNSLMRIFTSCNQ